MSKFRSRLARYDTYYCDQIMPVPVIPKCAIACSDPKPICEYKPQPCSLPQLTSCPTNSGPSPLCIPNYNPQLSDPPTGTILTNTTNILPPEYLLCNGIAVSRTAYSNLFTVIGITYGEGDGTTTFNLPNLSADSTIYNKTYIIKT